jgi:chromosome segregation ATPase
MKRTSIILTLSAILASTGCASKKDLEAAQAKLAACEDERAKLEASVISWEQRFDQASGRWNQLEAEVTTALPKALTELNDERGRIIELVPEQVKSEVNAYLEDYFTTVMKGFNELAKDNEEIKMRMEATYQALEAVGADTRAIGFTIDQTMAEERSQRQAEQTRRQDARTRMAGLVDLIVEFDRNRIDCKSCPDRLKLNRKEREAVLGFHAELTAKLADLQALAGGVKEPPLPPQTGEEADAQPSSDGR